MVALVNRMFGAEQESLPLVGPFTTRSDEEQVMQLQSTDARSTIHAKRERLKEIVSRLGPTVGPSEIREEAYRVGFGKVSTAMLVWVRNNLWPDRPRKRAGRAKGGTAESSAIVNRLVDGLPVCPECESSNARVRTHYQREDGGKLRFYRCKDCQHKFTVAIAPEEAAGIAIDRRRLIARSATEKWCNKCKRALPVESFGKKDADLYRPACKECSNQIRAERQLETIVKSHGISVEQFEAMLARQGGVCAICKRPQTVKRRRRLSIDHCHKTGVIRGLLCDQCNTGIGNLREDPAVLQAAIEYLRKMGVHHVSG